MDAKEAIERMCALQAKAAEHVGFQHAADCFCKQSGFWNSPSYGGTFEAGYRNDGKAIQFIEAAVAEKIARENIDNSTGDTE